MGVRAGFKVELRIPERFPFSPPIVRFVNKVWHVNVDPETGDICVDILRPDRWAGAMSLGQVLVSIQNLLANPNAADPLVLKKL